MVHCTPGSSQKRKATKSHVPFQGRKFEKIKIGIGIQKTIGQRQAQRQANTKVKNHTKIDETNQQIIQPRCQACNQQIQNWNWNSQKAYAKHMHRDRQAESYKILAKKIRKKPDAGPTQGQSMAGTQDLRRADAVPTQSPTTADAGPTQGRRRTDAWPGRRADAGATHGRRMADAGPTQGRRMADAGPTQGLRIADAGPTQGRRKADALPTQGRRRTDAGPTQDQRRADAMPTQGRRSQPTS